MHWVILEKADKACFALNKHLKVKDIYPGLVFSFHSTLSNVSGYSSSCRAKQS